MLPVASSIFTHLFSKHIFFLFVSETRTSYGKNNFISFGGESVGLGLSAADSEATTAHGIFQQSNLTSWTATGRRGGHLG